MAATTSGKRSGAALACAIALGLAASLAPVAWAQDTAPQSGQATHTEDPVLLPPDQSASSQSASGQPTAAAAQAEDARSQLQDIEGSISLSKKRAAELEKQVEDLSNDRARRNAELIASTQRIKKAESDVEAIQTRLDGILKSRSEVRARLDGTDDHISSLLAALERISQNPPPALIVDPSDALGAARSAMLMSAVLPKLRARAKAVSADLEHLETLRKAALEQKSGLKANLDTLQQERLRIATLIEARKKSVDQTSDALDAERTRGDRLAARATALKDLIDKLQKRIDAVNEAARAAREADAGHTPPKLSAKTIHIALANADRTAPAVPFSAAKGYLDLPVKGQTVTGFGADDGFGGVSKGISIAAGSDAGVVAPADGWVLYKGPYLDYGKIVILNVGQGYTILLAGLDAISVKTGQFVKMGEPIGNLGTRAPSQTLARDAGVSRPTLYIELRDNDTPIDPDGWWAANANQTQSG